MDLYAPQRLEGDTSGQVTDSNSPNNNVSWPDDRIRHFRISLNLFLKASLGAHPFIWKWDFIHLQIKHIFIRMVVHQASLWWRGLGELGKGLLQYMIWWSLRRFYYSIRDCEENFAIFPLSWWCYLWFYQRGREEGWVISYTSALWDCCRG